ncbi:aconitase X swivel domain-containing protein [Chloroflexota bacterium]
MVNIKEYKARKVSPGAASGPAIVLRERLGILDSVEPERGIFIKRNTELEGVSIVGKVLIFISGKGSSSWSAYFRIACRHGSAPAALVNLEIDPFVALGCVLNDIPLVQTDNPEIFDKIKNDDIVRVDADKGLVSIVKQN